MSSRAAWRLESLMFARVYDYVAGKNDWREHGFPVEGPMADAKPPTAGDVARKDALTCRYTDRLSNLADAVFKNGDEECIVRNGEGVVLGRVVAEIIEAGLETTVDQVMDPGPTTVRPGANLEAAAARMREAGERRVLVTTAEGKFEGVLFLADVENHLFRSSGDQDGS